MQFTSRKWERKWTYQSRIKWVITKVCLHSMFIHLRQTGTNKRTAKKTTHEQKRNEHGTRSQIAKSKRSSTKVGKSFRRVRARVCLCAWVCMYVFFSLLFVRSLWSFVQFPSNLERNEMIIMKTMGIISLALPQSGVAVTVTVPNSDHFSVVKFNIRHAMWIWIYENELDIWTLVCICKSMTQGFSGSCDQQANTKHSRRNNYFICDLDGEQATHSHTHTQSHTLFIGWKQRPTPSSVTKVCSATWLVYNTTNHRNGDRPNNKRSKPFRSSYQIKLNIKYAD